MAKGKYEEWLTPDGLSIIEGLARRGLTDEQIFTSISIGKNGTKWDKKNSSRCDTM